MDLPSEAFRDLQRCGPALFRYVVALLLALCSHHCMMFAMPVWIPEETFPAFAALANLFAALYIAVVASAVQAVFLSILGAAVDRPLWKYKGAADSIKRFFPLWLIINLTLITLVDIQARLFVADIKDVAAFMEFIIIGGHVMAIPVGVCIMHWGAFHWHELADALKPMMRLFSMLLLPIVVGFIQYTLASGRGLAMTDNVLFNILFFTLTDIPLIMIDAYIFTLVWRICMHYRSLPPETEDPFDF